MLILFYKITDSLASPLLLLQQRLAMLIDQLHAIFRSPDPLWVDVASNKFVVATMPHKGARLLQRLALLVDQLHTHEQLKDDEFRAFVGHGIGKFFD